MLKTWRRLFMCIALALLPLAALADSTSLLAKAQTNDATRYAALVAKNAEIRNTTDNQSFSIWWQPAGWTASSGVIVALHGHGAYATSEAYLWQPYAEKYGYAVLTLQWWFGGGDETSDYYRPEQMYPLISAYLKQKGVKAGTVLFTGFSRGSANSYAVAVLDNTGTSSKYFGLVLSNAGTAASGYPPNQQIASGLFGSLPFSGMRWAMYCGERDPDPTINGCAGMLAAKDWVTKYGATVVLFIDDPTGDHGGFMTNSANVETALATYGAVLRANNALPQCTLGASTTVLALGSNATLTASCSPAATAYTWTGGTCAGTSGATCTVSPTAKTSYSVAGSNANGFGPSASISIEVVDASAPTAPTGLKASAADATTLKLSWTASSDNVGVTSYKVYRSEVQLASVTTTAFTDTGLRAATAYTYSVSACDAAGNCSARSSSATGSTLPASEVLSNAEVDCLLNWAEDSYPADFAPRRQGSLTSAPYYYRRYTGTNVYLGVSSTDNHAYFVDPGGNLRDLGLAATWSAKAACR